MPPLLSPPCHPRPRLLAHPTILALLRVGPRAPAPAPVVPAYLDPRFAQIALPHQGSTVAVKEHGGWERRVGAGR
jgi:hypothetical protein